MFSFDVTELKLCKTITFPNNVLSSAVWHGMMKTNHNRTKVADYPNFLLTTLQVECSGKVVKALARKT